MIKTILEVIFNIITIGIFMYGLGMLLNGMTSSTSSEIPCFSNKKELMIWLKRDVKDYIESHERGIKVTDFAIEKLSDDYCKAWYEIKREGSKKIHLMCVLIKELDPYKVVYYGPNGREVYELKWYKK